MKLLKVFEENTLKFRYFVTGLFALLLLLPFQVSAQYIGNFEPSDMMWDYGDVEIGSSEPMSFIFESTDPAGSPLDVYEIFIVDDFAESFEITSVTYIEGPEELVEPYNYDNLPAGHSIEVVVTFTAKSEEFATASLLILSNAHYDPPSSLTVYFSLQGLGVVTEPPPDELMDDVMTYYSEGVTNETIYGLGNGNAPTAHLRIFYGMLDAADDLIVAGDYEGACDQLEHAILKSDGLDGPPDFIGGDGVSSLNTLLLEIMDILGC